MTGGQLYPFERNRYYPGKDLKTADFQTEQSYHINKDRFMNTLMYGSGIVCGCGVFSLDDLSILIESGVVIDSTGHEIIIDSSVVKKLSTIDGFDKLTGDVASLCVRFQEEDVHPVYVVRRGSSEQEYEHNRIREGYELFLVDRDTYDEGFELETEFLNSENIFRGKHYEGNLILPSTACIGRNVKAVLEVKKLSSEDVRLSCHGILDIPSFIAPDGSQQLDLDVTDLSLGEGEVWRMDLWMTAQKGAAISTDVILRSGSASAFENDQAISTANSFAMQVRLTSDSPFDLISREIGRVNLEMRGGGSDAIRLADIRMTRTESAYVIEEILETTQKKYIVPPSQEAIRSRYMEFFVRDADIRKPVAAPVPTAGFAPAPAPAQPQEFSNIATGVLEIPLGKNARSGDIRYSGEITHGLGSGNIYVSIGYEYLTDDRATGASTRSTVYGNPELFSRSAEQLPDAETAVRVLNDKGSFVVAAKLLRDVDALVLTYRWVAIRFPAGNELEAEDYYGKSITAQTPTVIMRPKESYYFGVKFNNMEACSITYELTNAGTGEITSDGVYTAPNKDGVFEIRIYCTDMPVICTYAYAIVKKTAGDKDVTDPDAADKKEKPIFDVKDLGL